MSQPQPHIYDKIGASKSDENTTLKTGRHARFIYIYLPELSIRRIAKQHSLDSSAPIAIYDNHKGADRLRYCNQAARSFGLAPDMALSDARALCALCRFYPEQHDADRQWLMLLARWCWRYSPVVGLDEDRFGIWIDATGAEHLWGGPSAMLADMAQRFDAHHLQAHIVMASYYGAALGYAIACQPNSPVIIEPGDEAHHNALDPLPLFAMRLDDNQIEELATIGMRLIGDLWQLKRGMVAMRFGEEVILRRDQLFGHAPERPVPLTHFKPVMIQQQYHEPIGGLASLETMVERLLSALCEMLGQMMLGCRQVEIGWQTIDGQIDSICHKLSRPSRDVRLLQRLFQEAGATIDAGFGIEHSWVKAGALSAQMPQAVIFDEDGTIIDDNHDTLSQLVDHLAARLGAERVQSLTMIENWIPEKSEYFVPAQEIMTQDTSSKDDLFAAEMNSHLGINSPRPMRLLSPPEPIGAIALLPDHPPSQIRWRGQNWRIRRATGPERIGPQWWKTHQDGDVLSRDYYRLETQTGHRLWVYRSGLPDRAESISWYLHGLFA